MGPSVVFKDELTHQGIEEKLANAKVQNAVPVACEEKDMERESSCLCEAKRLCVSLHNHWSSEWRTWNALNVHP